ncbi:MAG TPA: GAF and ANTAR domain-containing protein [Mycobacteriales bacterium]|nr:GAF and ANTAR domain-containing protein [Mycobacteriales bacterium]
MSVDREASVTSAFVSLADAIVDGGDAVDLLSGLTTDCARLLDVAAAGMLLADPRGKLHVVAASSERTRNLELLQLQSAEGPCLDCYRTGHPVSAADLQKEAARWPLFSAAAAAAGFRSVHAVPMRLRERILGALGLFGTSAGSLNERDQSLGQALAHAASVALVIERATADQALVTEELQGALTSRVLIEQAKGLLAHAGSLDMDHAFAALRRYARNTNTRLRDVAAAVVAREIRPEVLLEAVDGLH